MNPYIFPIKIAIFMFPILALLLVIPFALYHHFRYKYINSYRMFVFYTFCLYVLCAYFLVILPMPDWKFNLQKAKPLIDYVQLKPFGFISDFLNETDLKFNDFNTYSSIFSERAFLQVFFNVVLFIPFGIYLGYYFKKSIKIVIFSSFLMSLFFEITQLTGLYGLFNRPYRIFDIDDLILNTFGGIIGFLVSPIFSYFLPDANRLEENLFLMEKSASKIKRIFSLGVDLFIIDLIKTIIKWDLKLFEQSILFFILFNLYFIISNKILKGSSIGKLIFGIKLKGYQDTIKDIQIVKRYISMYLGIWGINGFLTYMTKQNLPIEYLYISYSLLIFYNFLLITHFVKGLFSKNSVVFFYEKISKTYDVSYRVEKLQKRK